MKKKRKDSGAIPLESMLKDAPPAEPENIDDRLRQVLRSCDVAPMFSLNLAYGRVAAVVEHMLRSREGPWPSPRERFVACCREAAAEFQRIAEQALAEQGGR